MGCSIPGLPVHHQLPELAQTHVHLVGDAIQPSHPLSSPSLPAFNLSQHQGFSNDSVLHIRWPKYWSFSFSISPSSECSGLISFRIDWLDLLAVQGTLKSLLQYPDAWSWCTGTTQRDGMGREEGGGFRMGNTCIPVADSFWYMAKPKQYCKVKK